jgi:hypothetical protein
MFWYVFPVRKQLPPPPLDEAEAAFCHSTQPFSFLSKPKVFHYNDNRYRYGVKPSFTRFTRKNGTGEQEATSSDLCTERVEEEAIRSQQNSLSTQRSKYNTGFSEKARSSGLYKSESLTFVSEFSLVTIRQQDCRNTP